MEELRDIEPDEQATTGADPDPDLWDWARTAGVSREELLAAVGRSSPGVN